MTTQRRQLHAALCVPEAYRLVRRRAHDSSTVRRERGAGNERAVLHDGLRRIGGEVVDEEVRVAELVAGEGELGAVGAPGGQQIQAALGELPLMMPVPVGDAELLGRGAAALGAGWCVR